MSSPHMALGYTMNTACRFRRCQRINIRLRTVQVAMTGAIFWPALVPLGQSIAADAGWTVSEGEEDWGKTCYMSRTLVGGSQITFLSSVGGTTSLYLDLRIANYPTEVRSVWRVDSNAVIELQGGINDYFGAPEFDADDGLLLNQIASGYQLSFEIVGLGTSFVDLRGSKKAFAKFSACRKGTGSIG